MVLGNPHFPWRGRYRFTQSHLTHPRRVRRRRRACCIGSPVVNIGWNNDVAWTHTVSTGYRFTPYEYRTVPGAPDDLPHRRAARRSSSARRSRSPSSSDDGTLEEVVEDVYRTDEGYVLDDAGRAHAAGRRRASSRCATRTPSTCATLDVFHEMAKARQRPRAARAAQDRTGRHPVGQHDGRRPQAATRCTPTLRRARTCPTRWSRSARRRSAARCSSSPACPRSTAPAPRATAPGATTPTRRGPASSARRTCPTRSAATGSSTPTTATGCPTREQPLEGFARIIGCEECERTAAHPHGLPLRARPARRHRRPRRAEPFTHEQLKARRAREPRVRRRARPRGRRPAGRLRGRRRRRGVRRARRAGTAATNVDSVGAHVFREFWVRTPGRALGGAVRPGATRWRTPRDLDEGNADVVAGDARRARVPAGARASPLDAPLGDLQVAGDEGAPRIPIGGGAGRDRQRQRRRDDRPRGRTPTRSTRSAYGSSHIQAVAFTDGRRRRLDDPDLRPRRPTRRAPLVGRPDRLFSQERWVDFPFEAAEVRAAAVRTYTVVGRPAPVPRPPRRATVRRRSRARRRRPADDGWQPAAGRPRRRRRARRARRPAAPHRLRSPPVLADHAVVVRRARSARVHSCMIAAVRAWGGDLGKGRAGRALHLA